MQNAFFFQHECCGINSYNDWRQRTQFPSLPPSCCMDNIDDCGENSNTRWTEGCDKKIEIFFIAVGSIGFSILLVEVHCITELLLNYFITRLMYNVLKFYQDKLKLINCVNTFFTLTLLLLFDLLIVFRLCLQTTEIFHYLTRPKILYELGVNFN